MALALFWPLAATAQPPFVGEARQDIAPDLATVTRFARTLGLTGQLSVQRIDTGVPGWSVLQEGRTVAHIGSSWEISGSLGYSGHPLDVLIAVPPEGRIIGAQLVRHNEPVLTLGISDDDITAYVQGFIGYDLTARTGADTRLPDIISRATVSTGVLRDSILRTGRTLAMARGIIPGGGVDRVSFRPATWQDLLDQGALAGVRVSMTTAAQALQGAKVPLRPSDRSFLHIWAGVIDTPTVGANLLGQSEFGRVIGALGPGQVALLVASTGVQSHRGTDWKKTGVFERITVRQGSTTWQPTADDYRMIRKLALDDAPNLREISVFALPARIDPTQPLTVEITATRPAASGPDVTMTTTLPYALPPALRMDVAPPDPLWRQMWTAKRLHAAVVAVMVAALGGILLAQESITRRPRLWRRLRLGFLAASFLVLGMGLNGQLSVVQVVAFLHSLLNGFHWETFLVEPVIFLLWSFTALGLLFWGRGVYCGWLCPFGALQELTNALARRLGVRQIAVPQSVHERLWVIKYTLFVAIVALSFYSMTDALILAEAEPFKTAISMRFIRAWPFLLFVAVILGMGLFIERFYCRYLCPLGAGLAIPAKLKIFDWLHRRPQCGRECRLCETQCTVGAIDAIGRINPNECVLCLRCQVTMNDGAQCPILKRRARAPQPQVSP
ncbi:4Fe-4S binding protein [Thalassovita sp.]|uniref:4Fe-4S binding protein n=1 Tax=Thalassovita sp. TaxID=1979401 RepID=UPI0029DE796F|nr:4Fe-4S binding protein [Thalassovita sp.]